MAGEDASVRYFGIVFVASTEIYGNGTGTGPVPVNALIPTQLVLPARR